MPDPADRAYRFWSVVSARHCRSEHRLRGRGAGSRRQRRPSSRPRPASWPPPQDRPRPIGCSICPADRSAPWWFLSVERRECTQRMIGIAVRRPHEPDDAISDPCACDSRIETSEPVDAARPGCRIDSVGPRANVDVGCCDRGCRIRPLQDTQLAQCVVTPHVHHGTRSAAETDRAVGGRRPRAVVQRARAASVASGKRNTTAAFQGLPRNTLNETNRLSFVQAMSG
jgi:hypothetical protein